MLYQQFEDSLLKKIKEVNPGDEVVITNVKKNNGIELRGICIRRIDEPIAPTVYLKQYYNEDINDGDIDDISQKIQRVLVSNRINEEHFSNVDKFTDFAEVTDKIFYTVINKDLNNELLKRSPHRKMLDLAVVYKVHVNMVDGSLGTVHVNNELLKMWGIQEEALYQLARKNTERLFGTVLKSMYEILIEMCKDRVPDYLLTSLEEDNHMYVCTNQEKNYGASVIFVDEEFRNSVQKQLGDFVIIPSSIHETIIIPYDDSMDVNEFRNMVAQVNSSELDPTDVLSNNVYVCKENIIQIWN